LREQGLFDEPAVRAAEKAAERMAADLRDRMNLDPLLDPLELFSHVYAEPTSQQRQQAALLSAELAAEAEPAEEFAAGRDEQRS
jgi:pyruvate dehydrogenase E1 component alpha subunit